MSAIDKYSLLVINIASTMILARWLTPAETGVYTVAWSLINIAQALREFGIVSYLVQEKELTKERLGTALTIAVLLGLSLTIVFAASAGAIARFYGDPRLYTMVTILSFNFVIVSFAAIGTALLQRALNFAVIMRINILSNLLSAIVSVTLVAEGRGPVALAWSSLLGVCVILACNLLYNGPHMLAPPSLKAWRRIGEFGVLASVAGLLGVTSGRVADLAIGRLLGLEGAGLYSRGSGLLTLFQQSVLNAILPVAAAKLSQVHREDGNLREAVLRAIAYITAVGWPALVMLGFLAQPIVRVFYGWQWGAAVPLAQILCAVAGIGVVCTVAMLTFTSIGAMRQSVMAQGTALPIYIVAVVGGGLFDLRSVAFASGIAMIVVTTFVLTLLNRRVGTSWSDLFAALAPSVAVAAGTAIVPAIVLFTWGFSNANFWPGTIVAGLGGGVSWLITLHLIDHPLLQEVLAAFNDVRSKALAMIGQDRRARSPAPPS
jgi:O-antigen/teichoic acid export membrane protein